MVENCTFNSNSASKNGAVFTFSGNVNSLSTLTIQNSTFQQNRASGRGSSLYVTQVQTVITINNSNFFSNIISSGNLIIYIIISFFLKKNF